MKEMSLSQFFLSYDKIKQPGKHTLLLHESPKIITIER